MKAATKFSGGGGVDLGMIAAGWEHVYGVEYDDRIAHVARDNGLNTITADILKIKPEDFPAVDWFHDSPPCPNFSTAKVGAEETANDIALAQAICEHIIYHRPKFYTLENVYGYRKSKSWMMIADTLNRHGYQFNYWHVNFADYGVPQTRKRMIVIARRDGIMPQLPSRTHAQSPMPGFFGTLERWVSWYEAIEDLIPTLPDSRFAPWQLERLPDVLKESLMVHPNDQNQGNPVRTSERRSFTCRVAGGSFMPRALIMNDADSKNPVRSDTQPMATLVTHDTGGAMARAFIMDGQENSDGIAITKRNENEPIYTVTSGTSTKRTANAYVNGRVVKMTTRAIARFQSFPDSYQLPDNAALAVRILGNAVPPLFMQRIGEILGATWPQRQNVTRLSQVSPLPIGGGKDG